MDYGLSAVHYQTVDIDGIKVFYREAGDWSKPTILLLHGFPVVVAHVPGPHPAAVATFLCRGTGLSGIGAQRRAARVQVRATFASLTNVMERFVKG